MSGYDLSYVALATNDALGLAEMFGNTLGLEGERMAAPGGEVYVFTAGASAIAVFDKDHPLLDRPGETGVDHIALATDDPAKAAADHRLAAFANSHEAGVGNRKQVRIDPTTTAGVRVRFAEPIDKPKATPGRVERIDHLGLASLDVSADEAIFATNLGCAVESRQTDMEVRTVVESFTSDKYGAVYHNRAPEPVGGLRVLFISVGDFEMEFLQEFDPNYDRVVEANQAGTTKQDQSAIGRFVGRRGAGLHHLALKTPDIDEALGHLAARGHRVIDTIGRPGSRRARIGFVHPAALGGVLLHFVERDEL